MKRLLLAALVLAVGVPAAEAAKRKEVYINKPSPPPVVSQPIYYPMAAVPPVLVAFDLVRRTSCDPAIAVSAGKCDPGFDTSPGCPLTGNFLLPAIKRIDSYCYKPK